MTNNKQQTAVEWLFEQMFDPTYPAGEQMEWLEEAKEIQKAQHKSTYLAQMNRNNFNFEHYFFKTYEHEEDEQ